jgi:hypothetical protein
MLEDYDIVLVGYFTGFKDMFQLILGQLRMILAHAYVVSRINLYLMQ